jgi:glycosyltransferase involved in cell wall biosynthesis
MTPAMRARIGIFHPCDPAGHVSGGIDSVIRAILRHAPGDLDYVVFGATSDPAARPVGRPVTVDIGGPAATLVPLVAAAPSSRRPIVPLTVRYAAALRRRLRNDAEIRNLDALDFHRIEPLALFARDERPKTLMLHDDVAALRSPQSDSGWRHAPRLYALAERRWLPRAHRVFCVRQSAVAHYAECYPALSNRFEFLPTSPDTAIFRPLDAAARRLERQRRAANGGPPADAYWLVSVGRLDRQKNPLLLLDALRRVAARTSRVHLVLVGDGALRSAIQERIAQLQLAAHVTLAGALPPAEVAAWLQVADVFVSSSAYEGMPIAVLEALASGVPVVTTDVGEVRLVVRNGVNGVVVSEQTADALAEGIEAARRAGSALGGAACVAAVAPYSAANVLARVYENHRALIAKRPGASS